MTDSITEIMKPDGLLLFANGSPWQRKHGTGVSSFLRQADPREEVRRELVRSTENLMKTKCLSGRISTNEMQIRISIF